MTDALNYLSRKGVVIMPAKEKGAYLMGIHGFDASTSGSVPDELIKVSEHENYGVRHYYKIRLEAESRLKLNKSSEQQGLPASVLSLNKDEFAEKNQQRVTQARQGTGQHKQSSGMLQQNDDDVPEQKQKRGPRL